MSGPPSWEAARRRAIAAVLQLAVAYQNGSDRGSALAEIHRAALDLALLGAGYDPTAEPWDPDKSRQLDLALAEGERARR
ncbi:MAG: hypothetical protein MUF27_01970 [Acidobacteria bacterium]|nr:hypothetical protein [Acidobacteriota bacterium]